MTLSTLYYGNHRDFMDIAVEEARKSAAEDGQPRPLVGAVAVQGDRILERAHRGEGHKGAHAEFVLLERKLGGIHLGADVTIYTTLEPCTHRGPDKTPCAQRIIASGVRRVAIGLLDPNPVIRGNGVLLLREDHPSSSSGTPPTARMLSRSPPGSAISSSRVA